MEKITILGAYGTKGSHQETSSFLINETHVIDAGNLLRSLDEDAAHIDTIWLTHSHLDHIVDIAYILDSYFTLRSKPLKLMGLPETLEAIQKHFLNDYVWPDFSKIPLSNADAMTVVYEAVELGKKYQLDETTSIEAMKTVHTVPSCGYIIRKNKTAVLITADTYKNPLLCETLKKYPEITALVLECSFPSSMKDLALESLHLTPSLAEEEISCIHRPIKLYFNHLKPVFIQQIKKEIYSTSLLKDAIILDDGDTIYF
ncbi:MBL fold metallo-hydrolase [Sulfurimonas sp. MAG313]|nr:MBL fold metallo-hydrolase [Sulfurimonas sp. MAG313]MDF1881456.1 MBL fold metallo-hydrolase [Sulfurimonas sp. MAG313]